MGALTDRTARGSGRPRPYREEPRALEDHGCQTAVLLLCFTRFHRDKGQVSRKFCSRIWESQLFLLPPTRLGESVAPTPDNRVTRSQTPLESPPDKGTKQHYSRTGQLLVLRGEEGGRTWGPLRPLQVPRLSHQQAPPGPASPHPVRDAQPGGLRGRLGPRAGGVCVTAVFFQAQLRGITAFY